MTRRPPSSTPLYSSAASDVYKRQVYRYAEYKNCDITVNETANYVDSDSISDYARNAVDWLSEQEIMSGNTDGTFAPQANSTRAQTAAVFMRINEKLK